MDIIEPLNVAYDAPVDVLYVSDGSRMPIEGDGRVRGVELDYILDSDIPCGVTVIGFYRNGWNNDLDELAAIIAAHLLVNPAVVIEFVSRAMMGKT